MFAFFARKMKLLAFPALLLLVGSSWSQTTNQLCEIDGVCDINLDTLIEVSFYDVNDPYGCPNECSRLETCHFYTVFADPFDPTLNKCLLFESCNIVEDCGDEDCVTCKSKTLQMPPQKMIFFCV